MPDIRPAVAETEVLYAAAGSPERRYVVHPPLEGDIDSLLHTEPTDCHVRVRPAGGYSPLQLSDFP